MHKTLKIFTWVVAFGLASCGAKKTTDTVTEKKSKLETLKKQQQQLNGEITALEKEIYKLDPSARPEKPKLVAVSKIILQNFNHYIDLQAKVDANNISYVTPRGQPGLVKAVYVNAGDYVKKGQLLLKLDDAVAKRQIEQLQTQLSYAQDIYNRRNNLWKENIGTEVELLSAKNNVDQIEKQIDLAKEQWAFTNVYSEKTGIAEEVTIHAGENFSGNPQAGGYIKLVNNADLKVTAEVPENYLGRVKTGSTVEVTLPDIDKTFNTTVSVSGRVINPNSRSFYIDARIPAGVNARPNQLAEVKILDYSATNVITIPVNTLQTDEKGKFVLVAVNENGKLYARKKQVVIGELYSDQIEIKSGLAEGDILITNGYENLYDGQLITTSAS
ncbi:MAG TPA: efflux RND transporter periplasmic adaptor subunit [Parafilimonas sp.]|nr:efflux RND transporter periplasmic adaptor subunit [Parafilimonas sp.]